MASGRAVAYEPSGYLPWKWARSGVASHIVVGSAFLVIGIWLGLHFASVTYDDVYLAYRYAQNILSGNGLVFNPGEHFLGTPAPLFVVLIVLIALLLPGASIVLVGGWLSALALAFCGFAVYCLLAWKGRPLGGLVAGIVTVFNPLTAMTLGSETPIYLLAGTGAVLLYQRGRTCWAAVVLGLAALNRSESVVLIGLLSLHFLARQRRLPWKEGLLWASIIAPWFVYATVVYGSPLTNSFTAKIAQTAAGLPLYFEGLRAWLFGVVYHGDVRLLTVVPLLCIGGLFTVWRARDVSLVLVWVSAQTVGYALIGLPFYHWYAAQLGVGVAVLVGLAFESAVAAWRSAKNRRVLSVVAAAYSVAVLALVATFGLTARGQVVHYGEGLPNPANVIYTRMGEWLKSNTAPNATVAFLEVGQIAYYSQRPVIDVLGLVTPGAAKRVAEVDFLWAYQYYRPEYIIYSSVFGAWTDVLLQQTWFATAYERVGEVRASGYPTQLVVYHRRPDAFIPPPTVMGVSHISAKTTTGEVVGGVTVGQAFKADRDGLAAIEVRPATYARSNQGELIFHFRASPNADIDIACVAISTADISDNAWRVVELPVQADSAGKDYYFYFEAPSARSGNAVGLWYDHKVDDQMGRFYRNGQPSAGTIAFKTRYLDMAIP
ncbi:MAG: hypothetical protein ACYC3S_01820 [Chloroflexota bacterium]